MKNILLVLLLGISTTTFAYDTKSNFSILGGTGPTNSGLVDNGITGNFQAHGLILGLGYSYDLAAHFSMGVTLVSNDTALMSFGIPLGVVRVSALGGYGMTNANDASGGESTITTSNYGLVYGGQVELRPSHSWGLTSVVLSNKAVLGGLSIHW